MPFRSALSTDRLMRKLILSTLNNPPFGRSFFGARATSLALVVVEVGQEQKMNRNDTLRERFEGFSICEKTLVYSFLLMVVLVVGLLLTS